MSLDRRQFLLSAAALAASARAGFPSDDTVPGVFPPAVRADFPIASSVTYLNSAAIHPMSVPASRALQEHIEFRLKGAGDGSFSHQCVAVSITITSSLSSIFT